MTLQRIDIPDSIRGIPLSQRADGLIDEANDRIEAFMLADQSVIEDFVTCDFDLLDQTLAWIQEDRLLTGNRFCELGSGFGVAAMLAALRGMESVGIEIESVLVNQSAALAADLKIDARFFCGSFVPRGMPGLSELASEIKPAESDEADVYDQIGMTMDDFDLFFAYPWPSEHPFLEKLFDACAANGALLLTYRGRPGMHLVRKI